jgi:hypothetical protein
LADRELHGGRSGYYDRKMPLVFPRHHFKNRPSLLEDELHFTIKEPSGNITTQK